MVISIDVDDGRFIQDACYPFHLGGVHFILRFLNGLDFELCQHADDIGGGVLVRDGPVHDMGTTGQRPVYLTGEFYLEFIVAFQPQLLTQTEDGGGTGIGFFRQFTGRHFGNLSGMS